MPPTHTPGDWQISELETSEDLEISALTSADEYLIATVHVGQVGIRACLANAELLADAPELLRIIDGLADALSVDHSGEHDCDACRSLSEANAILRKHGYKPHTWS